MCDLRGVEADCATVDAVARLHLAARRAGFELNLREASQELRDLLAFTGLSGVLGLEPGGKPEERKDPPGVEEERQLRDPAA